MRMQESLVHTARDQVCIYITQTGANVSFHWVEFDFPVRNHVEIGESLGLMDFRWVGHMTDHVTCHVTDHVIQLCSGGQW